MYLIHQSAKLLTPPEQCVQMAKECEFSARNCYASQDKITEDSYHSFLRNLIKRGHEAPLEFGSLTFDLTTSRAVLAEITRHRLASFCVESQRYIQEAKTGDITFIYPEWYIEQEDIYQRYSKMSFAWRQQIRHAEESYKTLIAMGATPQEAREVLPNSTACRIIMKANFREWRNIFSLRCSPVAYPQMRSLANDMLALAYQAVPDVFADLYEACMVESKHDKA